MISTSWRRYSSRMTGQALARRSGCQRRRKRGLGLAMLYHSFGAYCQRGVARCALSVDAHNASGATRLYERAGMAAQPHQEIRYEKSLRR